MRYLIVSLPDLCVLSYFMIVIATHERAVLVFPFFFFYLGGGMGQVGAGSQQNDAVITSISPLQGGSQSTTFLTTVLPTVTDID